MADQTDQKGSSETKDLLHNLSKYYREVLKYVSSSASRVLQNLAMGQRYGMVSDLSLLVKERDNLSKGTIIVKKPKKDLKQQHFQEEDNGLDEEAEESDTEEPEVTDEEVAWSAVNKIWRTQENNPYERETLVGQYIIKATVGKRTFFAPLLVQQVEITYDPSSSSFTITRLAEKPDINRGLIASLLPDDSYIPVRSEINEIFLETDEVDSSFIKKFIDLLGNHIESFNSAKVIHEFQTINDLISFEDNTFIANACILINTPRTGSFVLDDLDLLSTIEDNIENTPIEELLIVNFQEIDNAESEPKDTNPKQDHYFFPLKFNVQQQRICDAAMQNKLTVVWGPPGTGKSETISNLVCHLIASGKSVLVTSQQPKALEVVREKLKKNISLPAPKHPELTVPLELSLIRGQKESSIADDIRTKLEALSVYSLGIGSSYEMSLELSDIKNELRVNKDKISALSKRFSELKIDERKKYNSATDSPLRLHQLKDYAILDPSESFSHKESKKNVQLLNDFIDSFVGVGKNLNNLSEYKLEPKQIESTIERLTTATEIVETLLHQATSNDFNQKLMQELLTVSRDIDQVMEYISLLGKYRETFQKLEHNIPTDTKRQDLLNQIAKLSPIEFEKLSRTVKSNDIDLSEIENLSELLPIASDDKHSIVELEQNFEILSKSNLHFLSKFTDQKSVNAHDFAAGLFGLGQIDKRAKPLILKKIQEVIKLKRALLKINTLQTELDDFGFISKHLLNVHDYSTFRSLIDIYLPLYQFCSELEQIGLKKQLSMTLERSKIDFEQAKDYLQSVTEYTEATSKLPMTIGSPDWSSGIQIQECLRSVNHQLTLFKHYSKLLTTQKKLQTLPNSLDSIKDFIVKNIYQIPEPLKDLEKVVECHRLQQLYGGIVEETPSTVAKRIKQVESRNKELVHKYILFTRLSALYVASKSRLANANLVKLKQLLGRKKKTLTFLKKKDSIDFSQVLYYFPCWIVSIDDVSRYFPLDKGLFDYVIVDESSQCSQTSIPHLFYRAKNAIIVGDEKQLPNASLRFLQKGIMDSLQRKYDLIKHDKSQFFDCKEFSLLTFAQAAIPPVPLIEHFRCDPTIISWSNQHVYNNMMKIMTPIWENRFNPPMEVRYVDSGSEDTEAKLNKIEANEVLLTLKELIEDPSIDGLSLGVISPFRQQADYISELIYQNLSPESIAKYAIQSRTVDGFQGDERDVILYSMRFAPNGKPGSITAIEGGVNEEGFKRMNVAFTRARRKAIIFTSQKPSQFPGKLIKSFMEHADEVQRTYSDPLQPKNDHFDSQFEEDVCTMIRGKGINVVTQFECGGYRIDQVLFDKAGRTLALECDGDFKFDDSGDLPPEHYQRQATIERITQWNVERLTASVFYRDPEGAIKTVLTSLSKQPTKTERKIEQYPIEEKQEAIGLTRAPSEEEKTETEQVLEIVESNPKAKKAKRKSIKETSTQKGLFNVTAPEDMYTEKDRWFSLAHWGKTTGNLSSFENRFCYSLGIYLSKNGHLTDKQKAFGEKVVNKAIEANYFFES